MNNLFQNPEITPVRHASGYRVILAPEVGFARTRKEVIDPALGLSYLYGMDDDTSLVGGDGRVIEIWFSLEDWTAAKVKAWVKKHRDNLPAKGGK